MKEFLFLCCNSCCHSDTTDYKWNCCILLCLTMIIISFRFIGPMLDYLFFLLKIKDYKKRIKEDIRKNENTIHKHQ